MWTMTIDRLRVPGAELHYEVRGRGPALLMIPGGPTDAAIFTELADQLQDRYTVVTYDPRGNSRSTFEGGPPDIRVEVHADDAARLIASVDEGPAYVFGSSGGAIYGLDLAAFYPDHVRALVAHEPPTTTLLPDAARWRMVNEDLHTAYLTRGIPEAMRLFDEETGLGQRDPCDGGAPSSYDAAEMFERIDKNMDLFFRVLMPTLAEYVPAIDVLRTGKPHIVVGGGQASGAQLPYRAATALARRLGTPVSHFPGDHGGFTTHAEAFADRLHEVFVASGR
jgi:pimeloyl-ACP methyl ester carboxylesterase